jgi:fucose permease
VVELRRSPRLAVCAAFLAFGAVGGSWVPRLPSLKEHLHLTDGQVGIGLLSYAVGAVIGAGLARLVLSRGSRASVRAVTIVLCAALAGPGLAPNLVVLVASFVLLGTCAGFLDVLENAQAAALEREARRPLINGFHGFWSLGALVGSVGAGAAAFAGVAPLPQFIAVGIVAAAASFWFLTGLPDTRSGGARVAPAGSGRLWLGRALVAVSAIAFCAILVEGGAGDWSALYLRELSHASAGVAAAGFAGFSVATTIVRFRADWLTARTSPAVVARLGALIAVCGFALAIAVPSVPGAAAGFALVGIGVSVLVPLAFSSAANLGRSGTALAIVLALGYAGSIAGPALIGTTADHLGLRTAMGIPLVAAALIVALAGTLGGPGDASGIETEAVAVQDT